MRVIVVPIIVERAIILPITVMIMKAKIYHKTCVVVFSLSALTHNAPIIVDAAANLNPATSNAAPIPYSLPSAFPIKASSPPKKLSMKASKAGYTTLR